MKLYFGDSEVNLPNPNKAIVSRNKIVDYLLSSVHPIGRHKAALFTRLGYTQAEWYTLERDLSKFAFQNAQLAEETEYGKKYKIRGLITGPKGRSTAIITIWMVLHREEFPRFITAYPEN